MWFTHDRYRAVFWAAAPPAFLAVAVLAFGVAERERAGRRDRFPLRWSQMRTLAPAFWRVVAVASVFGLARFSEAFLILQAQAAGLPVALAPMVLVLMNVVYAVAVYPAGAMSDVVGRRGLLRLGFAALVAADLALAFASTVAIAALGVALWGLHMGLTQGLLSALVADATPEGRRGVAYGVFNLAGGVTALLGSALAGFLWDAMGPQAAFLGGGAFALIALTLPLAPATRKV
jgi:MFS family permease